MQSRYFWDGHQVIHDTANIWLGPKHFADRYHGMPCFDPTDSERYCWVNYLGWKYLPKHRIPIRFKTHLLLMGVS